MFLSLPETFIFLPDAIDFSILKIGFKLLAVVGSCITVAQTHTRKLLSFIVCDVRQKDYLLALKGNSKISNLLLQTILLKPFLSCFFFFPKR